jgi:hypothetical protein
MILKTAKTALTGLEWAVKCAGVAANLSLVTVFGWATSKSYEKATNALSNVGALPEFDVSAIIAWASDPATLDKVVAAGSFWAYAVVALGCGWMTILGLRWCYHFILSIIQNLRLQTAKALA